VSPTPRRRPRRLALFGLFGVGNIGNEASLQAGIDAVRRHCPEVSPVVVCANPRRVHAEHGVEAVPISLDHLPGRLHTVPRGIRLLLRPVVELARWVAALRFARSVVGFVVPGTGILDDFGVAPHQMPYDMFRWSASARLMRRPWTMIGVGAGPIEHPVSRRLMGATVAMATAVTYRDEASRAFMARLGHASPPASVHPDVAFALPLPAPTSDGARRDHPEIGLGLMAYYGWHNDPGMGTATMERYVESMVVIARGLIAAGNRLRILVGEDSDRAAVDRFIEAMERQSTPAERAAVVVEQIRDFPALLEQIELTDAVVATRYHNVIAALMLGRPTISIGYGEKFHQLMYGVGLGDLHYDIEELDPGEVLRAVDRALADADDMRASLNGLGARYRTAVDLVFARELQRVAGADPAVARRTTDPTVEATPLTGSEREG